MSGCPLGAYQVTEQLRRARSASAICALNLDQRVVVVLLHLNGWLAGHRRNP